MKNLNPERIAQYKSSPELRQALVNTMFGDVSDSCLLGQIDLTDEEDKFFNSLGKKLRSLTDEEIDKLIEIWKKI